jgi:hypothetical protein
MTVSVATGHQEFHPVYIGAANISSVARRSHGSGILPAAILPIPKGTVSSCYLSSSSFDCMSCKLAMMSETQQSSRRSAASCFMNA